MSIARPISFTVEDLKHNGKVDADKLERVLRQFQRAIVIPPAAPAAAAGPVAQAVATGQPIDIQALSQQVAKLVQPQLQATGSSPINTQNLLPGGASSSGASIVGTHAARSGFPPAGQSLGRVYYETDRNVAYVCVSVGGSNTWVYGWGAFYSTYANRPTDLGPNDAGFVYEISDYAHVAVWDGGTWCLIDGGGGYFVDSAFPLSTGWALCDGSATDFILNNTTTLALQPFTTPNEAGTAWVHHASAGLGGYSGTIVPPTLPIFTGTAASTGDDTPYGGTDVPAGGTTPVAGHPHQHPFTPAGTIALPGDPVMVLSVVRYFRR